MKRILVTGHAGFIGTHLLKRLPERGFNSVQGIDIVEGNDARDFFRTNNTRYDEIWHLAGVIGGRQGIEGNPLGVAVDLSIDSEMFNWALRTKPGRVIYMSSSAAYPIEYQRRGLAMKLQEDHINLDQIKTPDMSYGWSKLTGEYLARFLEAEGVRTHVFRPFSGYGEDQALDYPFPSFIGRGLRCASPFVIWGDGQQTRDFIHVEDMIGAMFAAIDQDVTGPVNLGWSRPTTFNSLAAMVAREVGYHPTIRHHLDKPVGVDYRVCDNTKMLSFYTPKITLEEGIRLALAANR